MKKIAFLFGGPGVEKAVSVLTTREAMPNFSNQFQILPIFITAEGQWAIADTYVAPEAAWTTAEALMAQKGMPESMGFDVLTEHDPELVFIGLHGEYGEDGVLQNTLREYGLAFIGSDSEASSLAMDKAKVFQLLQDEDIATPEFLEVGEHSDEELLAFAGHVGYPMFVLPADRGSSIGVYKVSEEKDLLAAVNKVKEVSPRVLLSQGLNGMEVSCGLLVTSPTELTALPPTEIIPSSDHSFFDYESKYKKGESEEITPARLSEEVMKKVQDTAKRVHHLVGADGYSRVDMIIVENEPYVLEINTLPGMTSTSLLPQQAKAAGVSYSDLLTILCSNVHTPVEDIDADDVPHVDSLDEE